MKKRKVWPLCGLSAPLASTNARCSLRRCPLEDVFAGSMDPDAPLERFLRPSGAPFYRRGRGYFAATAMLVSSGQAWRGYFRISSFRIAG